MHTYQRVTMKGQSALIRGKRHRLGVTYGCDVPMVVEPAVPALTTPGPKATMVRCVTEDLVTSATFVTVLTPGGEMSEVAVDESRGGIDVRIVSEAFAKKLRLTRRLKAVR